MLEELKTLTLVKTEILFVMNIRAADYPEKTQLGVKSHITSAERDKLVAIAFKYFEISDSQLHDLLCGIGERIDEITASISLCDLASVLL